MMASPQGKQHYPGSTGGKKGSYYLAESNSQLISSADVSPAAESWQQELDQK